MRYYSKTLQIEDENVGVNPQPIAIRRLNLRLLLSTEDLAGYDTMPIARIEKSERAEATPQLDVTYIPPVLACDAWHELSVGILQAIYDRIGRKIEKLAGQAVSRGLSLDSIAPGDALIFAQLRELNEAYATLTNIAFLEGVHPLLAYQELCRLVGQLAVFSPPRRPPAIPRYDHDDLGGCFYRLKNYLDDLLSIVPEPDYQERAVRGQRAADAGLPRADLARPERPALHRRAQSAGARGVRRADGLPGDRHEGRQLRPDRDDLPHGRPRPEVLPRAGPLAAPGSSPRQGADLLSRSTGSSSRANGSTWSGR